MRSLLAFAMAILIIGCGVHEPNSSSSSALPSNRIVAIGDSNTKRLPAFQIDSYCDLSRHDCFNAGVGGSATTNWIDADFFGSRIIAPFDICSIMLGGNDATTLVHPVTYAENIQTIINRCRSVGIKRIILHEPMGNLVGNNDWYVYLYAMELQYIALKDDDVRIGQPMQTHMLDGAFDDWMDDYHLGEKDHEWLAPKFDKDFDWIEEIQ